MKTARVLVIDEDRLEAFQLLQALGQLGIGAVYVAGDDAELLPATALRGIRIVFLDLKLINQPEAKHYVPYTVEVLSRCVEFVSQSTGIVCWTKHEDEISILVKEIEKRGIKPAFLVNLPHKAELTSGGAEGVKRILTQIEQLLQKQPAHNLLVRWEQYVHDAGTATSNALHGLCGDDKALMKLLATVSQAAADEPIASPNDAERNLSLGISAVHQDFLETIVAQAGNASESELLLRACAEVRKQKAPLEQRAKINSVLLTAPSPTFRPGNVYVTGVVALPGIAKNELYRFLADLFGEQRPKPKKEGDPPPPDPKLEKVAETAVPVCVEFTPACDHAASKNWTARAVAGVLLKIDEANDPKLPPISRLFAKEFEPIWIEDAKHGLSGVFRLFVSARCLLSMNLDEIKQKNAAFRLRHPIITDIQAWFASHAARPGYVSIH